MFQITVFANTTSIVFVSLSGKKVAQLEIVGTYVYAGHKDVH